MAHALIIDDNLIDIRWIQDQLAGLGFCSFDHAWTEEEAIRAAECRPPDLLVFGDAMQNGSPLETARKIAARQEEMAILFVTGDKVRAEHWLPEGALLDGPFGRQELSQAVAKALQPTEVALQIWTA